MADDSKTVQIDTVPHDALINIKVSGHFLLGLQSTLMGVSQKLGAENVTKALQKFKEAKEPPADLDEQILFILVSLVGELEKAAIDQGASKKRDISPKDLAAFFGIDTSES